MAVKDKKTPPTARGTEAGATVPRAAVGTIEGPVLGRANYILFGVALGVITLGFVILGTGDITLSPILLVIGYLVLVPLAILKR